VHNHHTDWHIWSGCAILTLLIFRLLWGFVGSSTARWSSFVRGPRALADYLKGRWVGIGHNPLGAVSVVTIDTSDKARDIHELWFNAILALIVLHVGAIIYYWLRGRQLTKPMITGRAVLHPAAEPMRPGKWWMALFCLAVAIGITRWVIAGAPPFGHWTPS
jgi:cytochrome b